MEEWKEYKLGDICKGLFIEWNPFKKLRLECKHPWQYQEIIGRWICGFKEMYYSK